MCRGTWPVVSKCVRVRWSLCVSGGGGSLSLSLSLYARVYTYVSMYVNVYVCACMHTYIA